MKPTLPAKSPRMSPHRLHHEHPVIPVTQPQQEISIDIHEEDGREVGGIVYHPLGKGKSVRVKERIRINEGMGEGAGWKVGSASDMTLHSQFPRQAVNGRDRGGGGEDVDHGLDLQRQPHRVTQETGPSPLPLPLPPAVTAQHHPSANHHHHHHQHQPHLETSGIGPRLHIQPPTPDNPSPPPALQIRSLNTPPLTRDGNSNVNPRDEGTGGKYEGAVVGGVSEGGGSMSRFKTTFLSKNKGPMSKTWARKSYLDELESMAPSSPTSTSTSPRDYRSAPVTLHVPVTPHGHGGGGDLESGGQGQGMRRVTRDQRELPRARSVYASPIALAQFKALPPMNPQGESMVAPR